MSMDFSTFISCAKALPSSISVLIRGPHGIGKSQGVWQLGEHFGLRVTDKRLSQMSEGDMIGLPKVDDDVTKFLPPDWYMDACNNPRVLFLDELNRATPEVMQAAFQVVLDRQLNGHKLHPETRVFAAINDSEKYQVNEMDPALLDRFWVVDLRPTPQDWLEWATPRLSRMVTSFIKQNETFLDPASKGVDPNTVEPSRRSWERLDSTLQALDIVEDHENTLMFSLARGFVGQEAAVAYHAFVRDQDKQITAEDILFRYDENKKKIQKLGQEKWNICIDKIDDYVTKNGLSEEGAKGLEKMVNEEFFPPELTVALWAKMTKPGTLNIEQVRIAHGALGRKMVAIFADPKAAEQVMEDVKNNEEKKQAAAKAAEEQAAQEASQTEETTKKKTSKKK